MSSYLVGDVVQFEDNMYLGKVRLTYLTLNGYIWHGDVVGQLFSKETKQFVARNRNNEAYCLSEDTIMGKVDD